jgi:hypothetical protein
LRYNQFGAAASGPVFIPKLYDGRNKTFFTASYEGLRQTRSNSVTGTAITSAERTGDFSALLPTTVITDPLTGLPFAGNIIPDDRLSAQAVALLNYLPLPQSGSTIFGNSPSNISTNQTLERIDQNIGDKIRLFFRYDWQNMTFLGGNFDPNPTNITSGPANNRNFAFGYTHTFTPTLINDFRFGRNHLVTNALNYFYVNGLTGAGTDLNIPGFTGDTTFGNPGSPGHQHRQLQQRRKRRNQLVSGRYDMARLRPDQFHARKAQHDGGRRIPQADHGTRRGQQPARHLQLYRRNLR